MSRALRERLRKLEGHARVEPEIRCFWKRDEETWPELRERAARWQAEKPEARWPEPLLIGLRDGEPKPDPNRPRRIYD